MGMSTKYFLTSMRSQSKRKKRRKKKKKKKKNRKKRQKRRIFLVMMSLTLKHKITIKSMEKIRICGKCDGCNRTRIATKRHCSCSDIKIGQKIWKKQKEKENQEENEKKRNKSQTQNRSKRWMLL